MTTREKHEILHQSHENRKQNLWLDEVYGNSKTFFHKSHIATMDEWNKGGQTNLLWGWVEAAHDYKIVRYPSGVK